MRAPRVASMLIAALLLAACTSPTARPPEPGPTGPEPPPPATAPAEPAAPPPAPEPPPLPEVLARPVTGGLQPVAFRAGDRISAPGVYFLNTRTGEGEGWTAPGNTPFISYISGDNRFVIAVPEGKGYILDRESRILREYDAQRFRAMLAGAEGALFEEAGTSRYIWTGPDYRPVHRIDLEAMGRWGRVALLSPDRRRLAILMPPAADGPHQVGLVDLASGEWKRLTVPSPGYVGSAVLKGQGDQLSVELLWAEDRDAPLRQTAVHRFTWEGEPAGEQRIPGSYVAISPDGRWIAWEQWLAGDLVPATVVADAASLEPRLIALGSTTCFAMTGSGGSRWVADSSGLVVESGEGYRLLTVDGQARELPAFAGLRWEGEPQPAPDHPDRFAIGRTALSNGAGTERMGVSLEGFVTPLGLDPWGESSAELRFTLPPKGAGGACREVPFMELKLLSPAQPLPEFPLVARPRGDCLELRNRPHGSGDRTGCLPAGTRLATLRPRSDQPSIAWTDSWWLFVKTEQGVTGWVPLDGGGVDWWE